MARSGLPDGFSPENVAVIRNAGTGQTADRFRREFSVQTDAVGFFHFIPRMRQPGDKISVIGKQNQSFAVLVESSRGNQTGFLRLRDQIDRFSGGMTVFQRADIAAGFIQHDIQLFRGRFDRPVIQTDPVPGPDPHGSPVCRHSVDHNPARRDQGSRSPPGTYARRA